MSNLSLSLPSLPSLINVRPLRRSFPVALSTPTTVSHSAIRARHHHCSNNNFNFNFINLNIKLQSLAPERSYISKIPHVDAVMDNYEDKQGKAESHGKEESQKVKYPLLAAFGAWILYNCNVTWTVAIGVGVLCLIIIGMVLLLALYKNASKEKKKEKP